MISLKLKPCVNFLKMVTCWPFSVVITYLYKVYETQNLGNTVKMLSELSNFYLSRENFVTQALIKSFRKKAWLAGNNIQWYLEFTSMRFVNKELIIDTRGMPSIIWLFSWVQRK